MTCWSGHDSRAISEPHQPCRAPPTNDTTDTNHTPAMGNFGLVLVERRQAGWEHVKAQGCDSWPWLVAAVKTTTMPSFTASPALFQVEKSLPSFGCAGASVPLFMSKPRSLRTAIAHGAALSIAEQR